MSYGSTPPPPPPGSGGGYPPPAGGDQPQQGGYQTGGYQQQGGYPQQGGYQPQGGYPQPGGYPAAPVGGGYYQGSGVGELAQWPQRAIGYLVDYALALPGSVLLWLGMPKTTVVTVGSRSEISQTSTNVVLLLLGLILALGVWVWNRGMKGGQGQTVGRKVAGVKLVDMQGQPLGTAKALIRDIAHIVDSIICGLPIGWLAPLWDAKRQTWADKIMNTQVVTVPK